jgi:hypothetical protein
MDLVIGLDVKSVWRAGKYLQSSPVTSNYAWTAVVTGVMGDVLMARSVRPFLPVRDVYDCVGVTIAGYHTEAGLHKIELRCIAHSVRAQGGPFPVLVSRVAPKAGFFVTIVIKA